jgi:hypothetical protein
VSPLKPKKRKKQKHQQPGIAKNGNTNKMKARMNEASTLAWDSGATDAIILF